MTTPYTCECLRGESGQVCGRPDALPSIVSIHFEHGTDQETKFVCRDCAKFMDAKPIERAAGAETLDALEHYKRRAEDAEAVLSSLVREICNSTRMLDLREARAVLARVPKDPHLPLVATMPKVAPGVAPVPEREVVRLTLPGREEGPK